MHTVDAVGDLRGLFHYDPIAGVIVRKTSGGNKNSRLGAIAGTKNKNGYRTVTVRGKSYLEHRLCWFLSHGEWPPMDIDHANGVKTDNRLVNLRLATRTQNGANTKISARNKSGRKGVVFDARTNKWQAQIGIDNRIRYLGQFSTRDNAAEAYALAAQAAFAEFARIA